MRDTYKEINFDTINSTNSWAKENISQLEDCTVVYSKIQTNGRGRLNRSWVNLGEGNLFMSIVLKPDLKYSDNFVNLTQYLSVVLCKVLEEYGIHPQIKWPNDVLVNGKKIAGILAETSMSTNNFKGIILGIGVNLNAQKEDFDNIDKPATALNLEIASEIKTNEFRKKLCDKFFENYSEFLNNGFISMMGDYIKRACFLDKELTVAQIDKNISGYAKGITEHGELILSNENKDTVLSIGDIL